jgi:hypothetical protein
MNTSQEFGTLLKLVLFQGSDLELGLGSFVKLMLEVFRIQLKPIKFLPLGRMIETHKFF